MCGDCMKAALREMIVPALLTPVSRHSGKWVIPQLGPVVLGGVLVETIALVLFQPSL